MTTPRTDYVARAPTRFLEQFRNKTKLAGVLKSYETQLQKLEDAAWEVILYRTLNTNPATGTAYAVGVQLDIIGRIVGRPRQGLSDSDYLIAIRGQIRINRSCGTPNDIIEVAILSLPPGYDFDYTELYPAAILVSITTQVLFTITVLFQNLVRTKSGGVRLLLEYSTDLALEWLTFADNNVAQANLFSGFPDMARWNVTQAFPSINNLFFIPEHPFRGGESVTLKLRNSATFPAPFAANTTYYVGYVTADLITLSLTEGGASINYTSDDASFTLVTVCPGVKKRTVATTDFLGVGFQDINVQMWPFQINDPVVLSTDGELPGPYVAGTVYYIGSDDDDNLLLLDAPSGTPINQTTVGSGTHTITCVAGGTVSAVLDSSVYL